MASLEEFEEAFEAAEGQNIIVQSRSGKRYYIHQDQRKLIQQGGLCYGVPLKPHPRAKGVAGAIVWMGPENVKIVSE